MIRAVVDTNILVSGLLTSRGNAALILLAIRQGFIRPCVSPPILDEYAALFARPKFGFGPAAIAGALALVRDQAEHASPPASGFASPDPDDTKFIDCAVATQADFVITGNRRHFPEVHYGVTQVASPGDVLRRLAPESWPHGGR